MPNSQEQKHGLASGGLGTGAWPARGPATSAEAAAMAGTELAAPEHRTGRVPRPPPGRAGGEGSKSLSKGLGG